MRVRARTLRARIRPAARWGPLLFAAALFSFCAVLATAGDTDREAAIIVLVIAAVAVVLVSEWLPAVSGGPEALRILAIEALGAAILLAVPSGGPSVAWAWIGAGAVSLVLGAALFAPAPEARAGRARPRPQSLAEWRRRTRGPRWTSAGIVLASLAVLLLISHLGASLRSCAQTTAAVGDRGVVEECRPLEIGDLVPFLLLAALFLLPDLSAIKIAGIGEIEMRQEEQEAQFVGFRRDVGIILINDLSAETIEEMEDRLAEAEDDEAEEVGAPEAQGDLVLREEPTGVDAVAAEVPVDRAGAVAELDSLWRRLKGAVELGELCEDTSFLSRSAVYLDEPVGARAFLLPSEEATFLGEVGVEDAEELRALARWASIFEREIVAVRLLAGAPGAGAVAGSSEAIVGAIALARRLGSLLPDGPRRAAGFPTAQG